MSDQERYRRAVVHSIEQLNTRYAAPNYDRAHDPEMILLELRNRETMLNRLDREQGRMPR